MQTESAARRTPIAVVIDLLKGRGANGRTQRDALMAFTIRVASAAILYVSQVALARWMGTYEYGIYVFVWSWVLVLGGLAPLGLSMAMIRLVPEYSENRRFGLLHGLLLGGRLLVLASSTLIALAGLLALWLLGDRISSHYVLPVYLALVCLPMYALSDSQDGIGRGFAWMGIALLSPYIVRPLLLLAVMATAYVAELPMVAATAAGAAVIATWLAAILQFALLQRRISNDIAPAERAYDLRSWLGMSFPLLVISGCELALQNADVLIISRILTPLEAAIYFAAAKTIGLVSFIHYAVGSAVAHRYSTLGTRGDHGALQAFVRDSAHWTFWPTLVAIGGLLILGKPLLWLFGPQFTAGYDVMLILAAGFLLRAAMGPADMLLKMVGQQVLCAAILIVAAATNIALCFLLIPTYGLIGAATATSLALIVMGILSWASVFWRLGLNVSVWHQRSGSASRH
ncbi:MAG: oligosaccharide flippase family protein [Hyphomicrobiaceae bacterium]